MLILNYLKMHFLFVPNAVYGKFFSYLYNCLNFHHYLEFNYTGPVQEEEEEGVFYKIKWLRRNGYKFMFFNTASSFSR